MRMNVVFSTVVFACMFVGSANGADQSPSDVTPGQERTTTKSGDAPPDSGFGSGSGMGRGGAIGSPTSIGGSMGSPVSGSGGGSQTFGGGFPQQQFPGAPTAKSGCTGGALKGC